MRSGHLGFSARGPNLVPKRVPHLVPKWGPNLVPKWGPDLGPSLLTFLIKGPKSGPKTGPTSGPNLGPQFWAQKSGKIWAPISKSERLLGVGPVALGSDAGGRLTRHFCTRNCSPRAAMLSMLRPREVTSVVQWSQGYQGAACQRCWGAW